MVLTLKETMIAFRCNKCGMASIGRIGELDLKSSMRRLTCSCGESELTLVVQRNGKIKITAPCMFCPDPHSYTLASDSFFKRELFVLGCTFTGFPTVIIGEAERVAEELDRSAQEIIDNYPELSEINGEGESNGGEEDQIESAVALIMEELLRDMKQSGRIECRCGKGEGSYIGGFSGGVLSVRCTECGAEKSTEPQGISDLTAFLEENGSGMRLE